MNSIKEGSYIPSFFNNVIGVGSVGIRDLYENEYLKGSSSDIYTISNFSNYCNCTDVFAPGFVYAAYFSEDFVSTYDRSKIINKYMFAKGTSYSAPIVTGISALVISENKDIIFNQQILKNKILELSQNDILYDRYYSTERLKETPNIFANNGKRIVYSCNNSYLENICGIYAGFKKCFKILDSNKMNCCSDDGVCGTTSKYCLPFKGCQQNFGD
ncbi:hypothetical protein BCR36DRAFT_299439 [Piromyces finnis]|uniref:Subtilisin-like protein n=1 Tax=Piromyces finnis TaxID=1754191 RepID=A0A1Y1V2C5_9FUNG|nr:hypothetical protein BCR36DRAFT_299439 [Piromyces finnis]|eukprot:ORX45638.1 hypothetical protein BCR36DRAFT_299439 [Piromyces finnis]